MSNLTRLNVLIDAETLSALRVYVAAERNMRGKKYSMADFINTAIKERLEAIKKADSPK